MDDLPTLVRPTMAMRRGSSVDEGRPAGGRGQGGDDGLFEVADVDLVLGGDEEDVLIAQAVVVGRHRLLLRGGIELVDDEEDREAAPLELEVEILFGRRDVALAVEDEEDQVGGGRFGQGLLADLVAQGLVGDAEKAARVDQREAPAFERALGGEAVPGHARVGVDEGLPPAQDAIEKSGFADVGKADDDHAGELRHGLPRAISRPGSNRGRRLATGRRARPGFPFPRPRRGARLS